MNRKLKFTNEGYLTPNIRLYFRHIQSILKRNGINDIAEPKQMLN